MANLFTEPDAWYGGFFEFTFELPQTSKLFVNEVLGKLWSVSTVTGCFLKNDIEPENQEKLSPIEVDNEGHWYGIANLPNGKQSGCGSFWGDYEDNGCWATFYIPLGSLANAYDIGSYPFKAEKENISNYWIREISNWLVDIAKQIHPFAQFEIGIIGFEIDFFGVKKQLEKGVPTERWDGLLIAEGSQLSWFPPTTYDSPHSINESI